LHQTSKFWSRGPYGGPARDALTTRRPAVHVATRRRAFRSGAFPRLVGPPTPRHPLLTSFFFLNTPLLTSVTNLAHT
jgi:hypothetical protein